MRLRRSTPTPRREVELTGLINIVFLMLVFFLVAGALRPFSARDIELSKIAPDGGKSSAKGQLIAHADGRLTYLGAPVSLDSLPSVVLPSTVRNPQHAFVVVADARLDARALMAITRKLRLAGHEKIAVMSERARRP